MCVYAGNDQDGLAFRGLLLLLPVVWLVVWASAAAVLWRRREQRCPSYSPAELAELHAAVQLQPTAETVTFGIPECGCVARGVAARILTRHFSDNMLLRCSANGFRA